MSLNLRTFELRPAHEGDAPGLCDLLNQIISKGGTTAYQTPLSPKDFATKFLGGSTISCIIAETPDGRPLGFQWLNTHPDLPAGCGDIASFTRQSPRVPGVGRAMFSETLSIARRLGLTELNATIRADNTGGLAYYAKMGFVDHDIRRGVPLQDGTPVDRVSKRRAVG